MNQKFLLVLILSSFGGSFVENVAQASPGNKNQQSNSGFSNQSQEVQLQRADLNSWCTKADALDRSLAKMLNAKDNITESRIPFEAEPLNQDDASRMLLDSSNSQRLLSDVLNRNTPEATALKAALGKVSPRKFFDVLFSLNKNDAKYVLTVLNHSNSSAFIDLFYRLSESLNSDTTSANYLGKAFSVLDLALDSKINIDIEKTDDTVEKINIKEKNLK
ncbi:hypothetical protein HE1_00092 [Holospora elegans E1]|uniref:Uncharacterized protein n=1 Tax=Holospora elegans E1 TaxID=1427503 RepID=A0A023DWI7_9PROT|nr:hypothetical protein [Holospora elegans]GAJ45783.1 hypothetical protein HE1_00092 [Holospora elegans E1]